MVINGKSGCSGGYWAKHLLKTETNERVEIKEMRGLYAEDLPDAFREMRMLAAATKARDYFYQANLNTRADEVLTDEQWEHAADLLEHKLHLDNHPRFIVEHAKVGEDGQLRTHRHIIWSRVDMETNTVVPDDGNYYAHTETARELEQMFDLAPVVMPPSPERDRFRDWETFRAQESGIDPRAMKAQVTALWHASDSGRAFSAALDEAGYLLAKGDRRDFVLIDPEGDIHSLARRIDGAKAADIRAKMGDLNRDSLMCAASQRMDEGQGGGGE
jgi:Relaxase/Mobilisation nuclease domain.